MITIDTNAMIACDYKCVYIYICKYNLIILHNIIILLFNKTSNKVQCRDRREENKHAISNSNVVNNINECDSIIPYLPLSVGNNIGDLHDQIPIETVSI